MHQHQHQWSTRAPLKCAAIPTLVLHVCFVLFTLCFVLQSPPWCCMCFVLCPVRFVLCAICSVQQFPVWCFVLGAMCSNPLMVLLHAHLHIFPSNVWRLQQLNVKYFRLILRARQQIFWLHRVANERVSKWFHKLQSSCLGSACLWIWPSNPPAPNFCPKKMSFTAPDSYKHGL